MHCSISNGKKEVWGEGDDSTCIRMREGDAWGKESSDLLLKMYGVQLLGWERSSSWLSRTKRSKGMVKKLCGVYLAVRNVINVTGSPVD